MHNTKPDLEEHEESLEAQNLAHEAWEDYEAPNYEECLNKVPTTLSD